MELRKIAVSNYLYIMVKPSREGYSSYCPLMSMHDVFWQQKNLKFTENSYFSQFKVLLR